ncbi:hypothetical protein [Corallococcus sicarius]|uniref:hypothetical protein n=1 Tax=Corallococcus sicarius TaxID=2316726 RepID=UPI0011C37093|nr:hypothetical protein [Corallococcus sicarius]
MRLESLVLLAMLWGFATLCEGCRTPHPLRDEFTQAVLMRGIDISDLPDTGDEEAVRRFVSQHGRDAVPLYRSVIAEVRHPSNHREARELAAAVEGVARTEGAAAIPLLRELVADLEVPFLALEDGISALKAGEQGEVLKAVGARLMREKDERLRLEIVACFGHLSHPGAIPVLRDALSREADGLVRREMEWSVLLLQSPDVCRLFEKKDQGIQAEWRWWCHYRCPGSQPGYAVDLKQECPERSPLP